jgi:hypothetical protein
MMIKYIRIEAATLKRKDLSDKAKLLLGLIQSFGDKGLRIGNPRLAELLNCTENNISKILKELNADIKIVNAQSRFRRIYSIENYNVSGFILNPKRLSKGTVLNPIRLTGYYLLNPTGLFTQSETIDITEVTKEKDNYKDIKTAKAEFEKARKEYPGQKRGLDTEFDYFKQKVKDWKEVLPKLKPAIEQQKQYRQKQESAGNFVPAWKHFKSWIYNRYWEMEFEQTESEGIKPVQRDKDGLTPRQRLMQAEKQKRKTG